MGRRSILTSAAALAAVLATAGASVAAPVPPSPNTPPAQPGGQLFPPGPSAPAGQPGVMPLPPPAVIYTIDQIAIQQITPELQQAIQPLHSLQEVEEALKVRGVTFIWRRAELTSASLPVALARQLAGLPPHEVFVVPQAQGGAMMGTIIQQRPAPPGTAAAPPVASPGAPNRPAPPAKKP